MATTRHSSLNHVTDERHNTNSMRYFGDPDPKHPESDGKPTADNTRQFQWIVTIKEGCQSIVSEGLLPAGGARTAFVAGGLL